MKKKIIAAVSICLLTVIVLAAAQRLVMPKYMGRETEGALIAEYYKETEDHDIVMVGDCEIYENISPIAMFEEAGVTCYLRGSPQQTVWQSYYLLEEMLNKEQPKAAVFSVLAMKYDTPESTGSAEKREAYNRITLDGMRWSGSKWNAVKSSMLESERFVDYIFPLLRYHSRITELEKDDFVYFLKSDKVAHNGYYMRVDCLPTTKEEVDAKLMAQREPDDFSFGENAWKYLEKMRTLCAEKGVEFILLKAPSVAEVWYPEWEEQIEDYAKQHGLRYINLLENTEETGVDLYGDTYDKGLHLNLTGAEKVGKWLGNYFRKELSLSDRRLEDRTSELYAEKIALYQAEKERQYANFEKYGDVRGEKK